MQRTHFSAPDWRACSAVVWLQLSNYKNFKLDSCNWTPMWSPPITYQIGAWRTNNIEHFVIDTVRDKFVKPYLFSWCPSSFFYRFSEWSHVEVRVCFTISEDSALKNTTKAKKMQACCNTGVFFGEQTIYTARPSWILQIQHGSYNYSRFWHLRAFGKRLHCRLSFC